MKVKEQLLAATAAIALSACSSAPIAQTFHAPSLAPAEHAVARVEQHVQVAKDDASKLAADCAQKSAGWQSAYTQLMDELTQAYLASSSAQDELGATKDTLDKIIAEANKSLSDVAHDRDMQKAKALAEYSKKMFWMKGFFGAAALCLLSAAWIFRGLWMPLIAGSVL